MASKRGWYTTEQGEIGYIKMAYFIVVAGIVVGLIAAIWGAGSGSQTQTSF